MFIKDSLKSLIGKVIDLFRSCKLYLILLSIVMIALPIFFSYIGSQNTDLELLRIFVESEVAMFAIVMSLSLVAVEIAASSYSVRVIDLFKNTPDFLFLFETYLIAIIYGLILLTMVNSNTPSNFYPYIQSAYYLGIFAFLALAPYLWNTLELLKPSTLIKMLEKKTTNENILSSIKVDNNQKHVVIETEKDPIQPIFDIVNFSIMRRDNVTRSVGLKAIANITNKILGNKDLNEIYKIKITENILIKLDFISKEDFYAFEVITTLKKIGLNSIEQKLDDVAWRPVFYLGEIGITAAKKNLEDETCWVSFDIGEIGETAAKQDMPKTSSQAALHLGEIGKIAAKKENIEAASFAVESLKKVGTAAAHLEGVSNEAIESLEMILNACPFEKKFEKIIRNAVESLGWIERAVVEHNSDYRIFDTIEFLGGIGKKASEQNLDKIAAKAAYSLQFIAIASSNQQLIWNVIETQSEIGKISANRGLNATTWEAAQSIGNLGKEVSDDQKLKALEFLEKIGLLACKHGTKLEKAVRQVVDSICWIGKTEVEPNKENEIVALKAISSLETIGKVAEKNPDSVTRHTVGKLNELELIMSKDGKSTYIGGRILLKLKQALSKFK